MGGDDPAKPFERATDPLAGPPRVGGNVALVPNRVRIGYVYKASATIDGVNYVYTGSTARELIQRICKKHARADFLLDSSTTIEVFAVDARVDVLQSGRQTLRSAINEALRAAEQKVYNLVKKDPDATVINDINAATESNMQRWTEVHSVAEGEITVETAPKYVVRLGESWILKGPWLGRAFAGLDIIQLYLMYRDYKKSKFIMAPYLLRDEQGVFTLKSETHLLSSNEYWKHYESGPLAGQDDVSISSDEFDQWKDEAESMWGYVDWKGDFVPGILRRELPEIDPNEA